MGDVVSLMLQHNAVGLATAVTSAALDEEFKTIVIEDSDKKYGLCACWKKRSVNESLLSVIRLL